MGDSSSDRGGQFRQSCLNWTKRTSTRSAVSCQEKSSAERRKPCSRSACSAFSFHELFNASELDNSSASSSSRGGSRTRCCSAYRS